MLNWGHTVPSREGPVEVTRIDYNEHANAETPEQPTVPICAQHVYDWWWELNARRGPGFDTLAPLTYGEVAFWARLTGRQHIVTPVEVRWLMTADDAWLRTIAEERKGKQDREKEKVERELSKPKRRAGVPRRR